MDLDWQLGTSLQSLYQSGSLIRNQQTSHILDTQGISTHLLDLTSGLFPVIQSISIAQSIRQSDLCMTLFLVSCLYSSLQVTQVIETVKNTDDVDTVSDGLLNEVLYYVIGLVVVT